MNSSETLIRVKGVAKKFSRSLRRSLWYGVTDIAAELLAARRAKPSIRATEFWALQDINFELKRGDSLALIGPNGAGKSTLLRLINGLIKPTTGRIEVNGRIQALIALGVGFSPVLTGRENIYIAASILGISKRATDRLYDSIVEFSGIGDFIESPVQTYSSGMLVRLGFSVATHVEPDILLIDEVLAVGDDAFRQKALNRMHNMLDRSTVIFVSHNLNHVEQICERALYLRTGETPLAGETSEIIGRYIADTNKHELRNGSLLESIAGQEGSGDVLITRVETFVGELDQTSSQTSSMVSGEDLTVRTHFTVPGKLERPVWFVTMIVDPATGALLLSNGHHSTVDFRDGYADITFPKLTLRPRTYPIHVVITESAVDLARVRHAASISVDLPAGNDPMYSALFKKDLVYWPGATELHRSDGIDNAVGQAVE